MDYSEKSGGGSGGTGVLEDAQTQSWISSKKGGGGAAVAMSENKNSGRVFKKTVLLPSRVSNYSHFPSVKGNYPLFFHHFF